MSTSFHCDGCGEPVESPVKVGRVLRREYCEPCAAAANQFVDAEEALRKSTHEKFAADRELLIARFSANDFRLPDVP
mgnify:FL=1